MARHKQAYLRIAALNAVAALLLFATALGWLGLIKNRYSRFSPLVVFSVAAIPIAIAFFPRRLRLEREGMRVGVEAQPGFHEFLRRVGWLSGEAKPENVRFDLDVRAGAGLETPWPGISPQRVLAFGLPVLSVLSVTELACFVARQLAFFAGYRTFVWAWLAASGRAASRLASMFGDSVFGSLFRGCAARIQAAVTEAMAAEHAKAYETAANIFGCETVERADRKIDALAATFVTYWNEDIAPALAAGLAPPVLAGFDTFLRNARHRDDSIGAAAAVLLDGTVIEPVRQAKTLVRGLPGLEFSLLNQFAGHPLRPTEWRDVAACAYLEQWHADVRRHASVLPEIAPEALAEAASDVTALGSRLLRTDEAEPAGDAREFGEYMLAASLANALAAAGWRFVYTAPGEPRAFRRHGRELDPFAFVARAVAGEVTVHEWRAWCAEAELTDLRLSA